MGLKANFPALERLTISIVGVLQHDCAVKLPQWIFWTYLTGGSDSDGGGSGEVGWSGG